MSEAEEEVGEPVEGAPTAAVLPADVQALVDAAGRYAAARGKLPAPGKPFRGPQDSKNFQTYFVALLDIERAAMTVAGRSVKQ